MVLAIIRNYRLRKDDLQNFLWGLFDDFDIQVSVSGVLFSPKALLRKLTGA